MLVLTKLFMHNGEKKIKTAIIIGAGPAGLTAAYELLKNTDIKPIIFEKSADIGGISKTVNYKGNRIDIGGHRFFSKSKKVMDWWFNILPLQTMPSRDDIILNRPLSFKSETLSINPEKINEVMLERQRVSRIFFQKKFFDYPISLTLNTFKNLGVIKSLKIAVSYIKTRIFPQKNELSLEEFYINRFGKELYETFFKDYTQKVWGVHCKEIKSDWGKQRIKNLSIKTALYHALKESLFKHNKGRKIETSLIKKFYYPKFGPGQLWEKVAQEIVRLGGEIKLNHEVNGVKSERQKIVSVDFIDKSNQKKFTERADYFISTMPIKELIKSFGNNVPNDINKIAENLMYRDFITVGLLVKKLKIKNTSNIKTVNNLIPDNWLYIQDTDVMLGRIQVFNNWSPYMVKDFSDTVWLGLEYFCSENDSFWKMTDEKIAELAINELSKINILDPNDTIDRVVVRMLKAYPSYFGSYDKLEEIKKFTDGFENLFLIGRNGMHRYNNMDHSMLSAMAAVENIIKGIKSKENIWVINAEDEYHEKK